jgi:outer membrane lipoprotein LolB
MKFHDIPIQIFLKPKRSPTEFLQYECSKSTLLAKFQIKILTIIFMIVWLMACVNKPPLEDRAVVTLNNNLAQLTQWKLKGRIAWITAIERKSAYMNWQQNNANMQFNLSNVLGINVASISFDGQLATLRTDGKKYQGPSPSMLIYQTTGWQVPLELLSNWVKGAASVNGRMHIDTRQGPNNEAPSEQQITRYENGLIKQIKPICAANVDANVSCDEWTIDYTSYKNVTIDNIQYQLPEQISMFNPVKQATIKMRISEWRS